ncbi:MAG: hypothetical protein ACRCU0_06720 [Candidatus Rhabdochlamydia sp.]
MSINITQIEKSEIPISIDFNTVKNRQNNWCACFGRNMRTIRSGCQFPSNLINFWKNNTTLQKVMETAVVIYCMATTIYIIYLESQNAETPVNCLSEISNASLLLNQPLLGEIQESSENYGHVLNSVFKKCEKEFEESGAEETSLSGMISMQICYPLINRVCKASEDILQIMSKLKKIQNALRENLTLNDINRVNNHLQNIQSKFFCKDKGILLSN